MKAVYNILNNQDKVTMKHFYHIRYHPDLDKGFCAMQRISCVCTDFYKQLSKPWLLILDKTLLCYFIKPKACKYSSILHGYNKWYIAKLILNIKMKPDKVEIK